MVTSSHGPAQLSVVAGMPPFRWIAESGAVVLQNLYLAIGIFPVVQLLDQILRQVIAILSHHIQHHARRTKRTSRSLQLRRHASPHLFKPTPHTPSRKPASGDPSQCQCMAVQEEAVESDDEHNIPSPVPSLATTCKLQWTLANIASERHACLDTAERQEPFWAP